ncbi:hypothetical protein C0992_012068 [Termitomyces sp. T32_za158]|nr:hypothetical protein C0992_012068 [Termitomyces sp. T32_za158]
MLVIHAWRSGPCGAAKLTVATDIQPRATDSKRQSPDFLFSEVPVGSTGLYTMVTQSTVRHLFRLNPASPELSQYIAMLATCVSTPNATIPQVKSYSDVVYFNYYALGLSLLFTPASGYTPKSGLQLSDLSNEQLFLDSLDIYNIPPQSSASCPRSKGTSSRTAELMFSSFPLYPLVFDVGGETKDENGEVQTRPSHLEITSRTTGKDFVQCLGEPDRKGGGAGPSSGSIGIWCEWKRDGIMIEFGGDEAKGPQAWERGKDAVWKVITLFSSTSCN